MTGHVWTGRRWRYLYRSVNRAGRRVDTLLTAKRDVAAAWRLLERPTEANGVPEKVTIDQSGTNTAAIEDLRCGVIILWLGAKLAPEPPRGPC